MRGDGADLIEQSLQLRRVAGLSGELPPGLQADFGVTQLLGQFERTLRPLAAAVRIGSRLAGEGEVAIRLGELAARRQRLEHAHGFEGSARAFLRATGAPEEQRAPPDVVAFLERVTHLAPAGSSLGEGCNAHVVLVGDEARARLVLEQLCALAG